ncbi:hypothetical protein MGWOODY_Mmi1356 [hydrothermal vent metagenome]|uniref:Uncharacterized protein n=1 Tax=hydrothermal vent metagenome TaxID=652676 RepID=A0A160VIZ7_9ZZZZ
MSSQSLSHQSDQTSTTVLNNRHDVDPFRPSYFLKHGIYG